MTNLRHKLIEQLDYNNVYNYLQHTEEFGNRLRPTVHTSRRLSQNGEVIYDVSYTIGKDGYRKASSGEKFNAYIYRGSHNFGEGLNDDETLAHYLLQNRFVTLRIYEFMDMACIKRCTTFKMVFLRKVV